MSAPDLLARAARAASREVARAPIDAEGSRQRLLAMAMERRRRGRTLQWMVPALAGVLLCSTAWAAATGRIPRPWAHHSGPPATGTQTPRSTRAPHPERSTAIPVPPAPAPLATTNPSSSVAVTTVVRLSAMSPLPRRTLARNPRPTHPQEAAPDDEALYAAAHHAHFVVRDPAIALAAWNAYLAAAPGGRYAPEARYNRALSLVRLGRSDEARAALELFADGTYGPYRQREARMLLDALAR